MDIKEILKLTPQELAKTQHKQLKEYVLTRLRQVVQYIQNDNYEEVSKMLGYSPAGDDMGCSNNYILFEVSDEDSDIGNVMEMLKNLKSTADKTQY